MSRTSKPKRDGADKYPTPQWCIDDLARCLEDQTMIAPHHIVDLGAGDGRIGKTLHTVFSHSRLTLIEKYPNKPYRPRFNGALQRYMVGDAVKYINNLHFRHQETTWFVSNPPFNQALKFVEAATEWIYNQEQGSQAIFLLRLDWLGTIKRSEFLKRYPPTKIKVIVPRPRFKGRRDSGEYAWMFWQTIHDHWEPISILRKE